MWHDADEQHLRPNARSYSLHRIQSFLQTRTTLIHLRRPRCVLSRGRGTIDRERSQQHILEIQGAHFLMSPVFPHKVVCWLIEKQDVAALFKSQCQVEAVSFPTLDNSCRLLLIWALKTKGCNIGTRWHFHLPDLHKIKTVRDNFK